jgi:ABC-type antimicrobial peptide transport system permease subunit
VPFAHDRLGWDMVLGAMSLVVNSPEDQVTLAGRLRDAVRSIDADQALHQIATMEEVVDRSLSDRRLGASLFAAYALVAAVLAALGIFGVVACTVAQRTRELGVRMALGAEGHQVMRLVLGQGLRLAAGGAVIGLALALGLSRSLAGLASGVSPTDPVSLAAAGAGILAVTLAACYVPLRRALATDPLVALRSE